MPFYGQKQAAAIFSKYPKKKARKIVHQLKSHGKKKPRRKQQ